jgi:hypothetical protein
VVRYSIPNGLAGPPKLDLGLGTLLVAYASHCSTSKPPKPSYISCRVGRALHEKMLIPRLVVERKSGIKYRPRP